MFARRPRWPPPKQWALRNEDETPQPLDLFLVDVLANLFLELRLRFPRPVLVELVRHALAHTGNGHELRLGGGVEIERDEGVLREPRDFLRVHVLADLFLELRVGTPRTIFFELVCHALAGAGDQ